MAELPRTTVTGWCDRCQAEWTGSHTCRPVEAADPTLPGKAQAAAIALLRMQLAHAEDQRDRAVEAWNDALDQLVGEWHANPGDRLLPDVLGMNDEQYEAWVRDPKAALLAQLDQDTEDR